MIVKFNLVPWAETLPKMTLDEATAEMKKLKARERKRSNWNSNGTERGRRS
jgi:hypothetical protein